MLLVNLFLNDPTKTVQLLWHSIILQRSFYSSCLKCVPHFLFFFRNRFVSVIHSNEKRIKIFRKYVKNHRGHSILSQYIKSFLNMVIWVWMIFHSDDMLKKLCEPFKCIRFLYSQMCHILSNISPSLLMSLFRAICSLHSALATHSHWIGQTRRVYVMVFFFIGARSQICRCHARAIYLVGR